MGSILTQEQQSKIRKNHITSIDAARQSLLQNFLGVEKPTFCFNSENVWLNERDQKRALRMMRDACVILRDQSEALRVYIKNILDSLSP